MKTKYVNIPQITNLVASMCADLDFTREICRINHKKFYAKTKLQWALPDDKAITIGVMRDIFSSVGILSGVRIELETVEDMFNYIATLSLIATTKD